MDHRPQAWGRPRDDVYGAYDASFMSDNGPKQNTQQPIVTGTSVIAVKFKDGVVIAADNLASYGSLARFTDVKRLRPFADSSVVGFSGDISDMQYLDRHLIELSLDEAYTSPMLPVSTPQTFIAISQSFSTAAPFLAAADLLGSTYSAPSLATGFGAMLAQPIMRRHVPDEEASQNLDKEGAINIIKECMKVLYYRDARSLDSYSMAVVTKEGVEINEGLQLEAQSWAFAERIRGYGTQTV
ncbi:Proteasome subunit beta type-7 [Fusarium culmorum]|uniref:Proteasome subunit beta n=1 Tax=Fusarium culmorum TaxID=5516 RepID=A0A2T4H969_FUSCU|nr:Proteasome subunit beta type-7 [Fusarium culmorum]